MTISEGRRGRRGKADSGGEWIQRRRQEEWQAWDGGRKKKTLIDENVAEYQQNCVASKTPTCRYKFKNNNMCS